MFGVFSDLAKVAVGVVLVPIAMVADVVKMPCTEYDDPFGFTTEILDSVQKNLHNAIKPD